MGIGQSLPLPRYGCCIRPQNPNRCKENHSRTPKVKVDYKRNFSAAFNFSDSENWAGSDLLNINAATEEEFMTLPGINRQTAQNIVEYRRKIDGFRKVEDLALVTGVGATRLSHIRPELCIGKRGLSKNSSASSSGIDISMHDNVSRGSAGGQAKGGLNGSGTVIVNVNTANVFQLMKVRFISQYLAENVVAYRDRKGPFSCFDDLLKVKGIKPEILSAIQPCLVLVDDPALSTTCVGERKSVCSVVTVERHIPESSCKSQELLDFGPMKRKSCRSESFHLSAGNDVQVASWNLDSCSLEKMENPGVREVIAMTLLENRFGIVALQEVTDPKSLQKLVSEFNSPVLPDVKSWTGSRGNWKYIVSPAFSAVNKVFHLAFLYDADKDIQLVDSRWSPSSKADPNDQVSTALFLAEFKVHSVCLTIANVHVESRPGDLPNEQLVVPITSVFDDLDGEGRKNVLLAGQFGGLPNTPALNAICSSVGLTATLSDKQYTNIGPCNAEGSVCMQNVCLSQTLMRMKIGNTEVIRTGLTSPWIPNGSWGWGGTVSAHCPIVTTFRLDGCRNEVPVDARPSATFTVGSES